MLHLEDVCRAVLILLGHRHLQGGAEVCFGAIVGYAAACFIERRVEGVQLRKHNQQMFCRWLEAVCNIPIDVGRRSCAV